MSIPPLETDQASAVYEEASQIAYIAYHGKLGGEVTRQVYDWLDDLYEAVGVEAIYGQIFDFRAVTEFLDENLQTARRVSKLANIKADTSNIPVALLISTFYHQEILRSTMRIGPEHERKRIVWSHDEAMAFLKLWHTTRTETAK
ncbi:MAG: hypothetical protein SF029_08820 [bacterium]|nr:hypothetical protein [bacterium]